MPQNPSSRRALFALVVVSIALMILVIAPFAEALFLAAVLAGALYPLVTLLARRLRGRRSTAAGVTIVAVLVLLLGPLTGLTAFIVGEASHAMRFVTQTVRSEGMTGLVERFPAPLRRATEWVIEKVPVEQGEISDKLNEQVGNQGGKAAAILSDFLSATGSFVFQTAMMLIALYAFLVEGARLVRWLEEISPLESGQLSEILREFRRTSMAVMTSTAATSGAQAVVAFVGYLIARVPHPFFFTFLTFIIAFIPAVGAAAVCLVASLLLFATGHMGAAIFLAIWGVVVVGLVDNIIKPVLVKRGLDLDGVVIFFALIGGIATFGAVGLLMGPLAVALFLAVVRFWHRSYGKGPKADVAVAQATAP